MDGGDKTHPSMAAVLDDGLPGVARAAVGTEDPEEALAAVLATLRAHTGATGSAAFRADGDRLVSVMSSESALIDWPMDEAGLTDLPGEVFPLMLGGRLEGVVALSGVPAGVDRRERTLMPLLDVTALVLRNLRLTAERRSAEEVRSRLAMIVATSTDAIIGKTMDGTITTWNAAAERQYGYSEAETIGRSISLIVPTDRDAEIVDILERLGRGECIEDFETVRVRKDGRRIHVSLGISPLYDAAGHLIGAASIARDISHRKRAEQQIRALNEELEVALSEAEQRAHLFRTLHELAVAIGGVSDVSELARLVVGCARRLVGADYARLYLWDETRTALLSAADEAEPAAMPIRIGEGLTGRTFALRHPIVIREYPSWEHALPWAVAAGIRVMVSIPLVVADRGVGCLTLGFSDQAAWSDELLGSLELLTTQVAAAFESAHLMAARERSERQVRDLNAQLEARVRERTVQLEATVGELEAFSYSISHDLRAPLRSMAGFSRILEEEHGAGLSDEARGYLGRIRNAAGRMGRLIDDLLCFSRLSRQPLVRQTVSPVQLIEEALEDLAAEREGRRVDIAIGALPPCAADPGLLKQVFVNLLGNALKFTRGRAVAHIEIGHRMEAGEVVYYVRDNGTGFDMRYADRLFGVFQRLHRDPTYEGTGAGLAITQRILHRHGGRIWAEAAVDAGATFSFTLGKDKTDA